MIYYDHILRSTGGNQDDAAELVQIFNRQCDQLLPALRKAVSDNSAEEVMRIGHKFRGSLSSLGASHVCALVVTLEHMTNSGEASSAEPILHEIESEIAVIREDLTQSERSATP